MTVIKRGLNLPISGAPQQRVEVAKPVGRVALLGEDYVGMRPTMLVKPGDRVQLGQPLFTDKKTAGVQYTAPGTGTVAEINRGAKRKFQSLVIDLEGEEAFDFSQYAGVDVRSLGRERVTEALLHTGLWTALRRRPYGKVPVPGSQPHSIFVQAMDTNPLAADPSVVLADRSEAFTLGLLALRQLTDGTVYVCKAPKGNIPSEGIEGVRTEVFEGPHPAGLPGTHIHFLDPVGPTKTVWYLNYQDVTAIGALFQSGRLDVTRTLSLAGPVVKRPRLLETRQGAHLAELLEGEIDEPNVRVISGSVLCGRAAAGVVGYLGRFHQQVSVLQEGNLREFFGWQRPGFNKFSVTRIFASALLRDRTFDFTTSTEGSERAMVPVGTYERVMPLDILPTQLLRALIVRDSEQVQELGALELEEEDLALCTFVCPGKYEYGSILRDNLTQIEKEG